jgi:hypothetical protein
MEEIVIVELVNGEDLLTLTKAFRKVEDAETFFIQELKKLTKGKIDLTDEDISDIISDGYYADDTHFSLIIKEITLN